MSASEVPDRSHPGAEFVDGTATLRLTHDIDARTAPVLRAEIVALLDDATVDRVVVDLTGVRFVDSSGLGALIAANAHARGVGTPLRLRSPQSQLLRLMAMTQTYSTFSWG